MANFKHIRELDGIRGIAVLAVFFHHICYADIPSGKWVGWIAGLSRISFYGSLGVDIFFVLSGFLITSLLVKDREKPAYYKDFYWKRALRILPLYVVFLILTLLIYKHSLAFVAFSALFLANFSTVFHVQNFGSPFWSLAVEEQFYLLWPTVVRKLSVRQVTYFALAIGLGCVALRFGLAMLGHHNYYLTFMRCDGLALGALIACTLAGGVRRTRPFYGLFVGAVVLLGLAHFMPGGLTGILLHDALVQTGATLLFGGLMGLSITHTGSRATAFLRWNGLTFFGLISYALYLVHTFVSLGYDRRWPLVVGDTAGYVVRFWVIAVVTVLLCLVSRYGLELPFLGLRKYVLRVPVKAETELPLVD